MTTSVLDRISEIRSQDNQLVHDSMTAERKAYFDIAVREYLGKSKADDAQALLDAMALLELTEADFAKTVSAVAKACQATAQLQHAQSESEGSHERQQAAQREWRIATARANRAQRLVTIAKRKPTELYAAQQAFDAVANEFPDLFSDEASAALASQVKAEAKLIKESEKHAADGVAAQELAQLNRLLANEELQPVETLDAAK